MLGPNQIDSTSTFREGEEVGGFPGTAAPRARVQADTPDIQLVLTRLSGNPDLFASFDASVPTDAAATHPDPNPNPNPDPNPNPSPNPNPNQAA